jgi:hypothetical protein
VANVAQPVLIHITPPSLCVMHKTECSVMNKCSHACLQGHVHFRNRFVRTPGFVAERVRNATHNPG